MRNASILIACAALSLPVSALAQTTTAVVAEAPVDQARLAAAKPVVEQIWPIGTYARIMRATMDQVVSASLSSMYGMRAEDMMPASAAAKSDTNAGKTLGQLAAAEDPAFEERMRITMKVMTNEMIVLMTEVEPDVRIALAQSYARKFDVAQLNDLHRFFETPTGRVYAADSMMLMASPDMMKAMQGFVPRMMQAMPGIMAKVGDATKHLPPVKKKDTAK